MIVYLIASSCLFILHTIQISMQQKEIRKLQEKVRELRISTCDVKE